MGIRCSLTGHVWSETETDVEKDIRENELAVTEIEKKKCGRCGETEVVSENTEVRVIDEDDEEMEEEVASVEEELNVDEDDAVLLEDGEEVDPEPQGIGVEVDEREEPEDDSIYICSDCGYETSVTDSSLRTGDICPECSEGYIEEKQTEESE